MPLTLDELDGRYEIRTETAASTPYVPDGDGVTEIRDGMTWRKDRHGCIWESRFTPEGERVRMESTIDPSHAPDGGRFITDENGNPTKSIIRYQALLGVSRDGGRIILSGDIRHGATVTRITMTRLQTA